MMRQGNANSVVIAAVVAAVALAGMVISVSQAGTQGAQTIILPAAEDTWTFQTGRGTGDLATYEKGWNLGEETAAACLAKVSDQLTEITQCCKADCTTACTGEWHDLCQEKCSNVCQNTASQQMGIQLRTR